MKTSTSILNVKRHSLIFLIILSIRFTYPLNILGQSVSSPNDSTLAESYGIIADSLFGEGKTDSASHYYRLSAGIFRRAGLPDQEIGCYKMLAINNLNNPSSLDSLSKTADEFYMRAKELFGDTSKWMVDACVIRAFAFKDMAKCNEGISSLNKALEIAPVFYEYYHVKTGLIYGNLGIQYHEIGKYNLSIDSYYRALDIDRRLFGENHQTMATNYNNLGITYSEIGLEDSAIYMYQKAVSIWINLYGEDIVELSDNYTNLAVASITKGDYYQAILYESKSLKLRLKYLGEDNDKTALCYSNMGTYYEFAHDYNKALEYEQKANAIKLKVLPADHPDIAISYLNLASLDMNMNKYEDALSYQNKAFNISVAVYGKVHSEVARVLDYMADSYFHLKDYEKSLQTYREAILIIQQSYHTKKHPRLADLYNHRAKTYIELKEYDSAFADIDKSLLANYKFSGDDPNKLPLNSESFFSETIYLNSLCLKAKIVYLKYLEIPNDISLLRDSYNMHVDAIKVMEQLKKTYLNEESKLFLSDNISDLFQRAVDIAYKLYEKDKSDENIENLFYLVEKSKSGILQEGLAGSQAAIMAGIPDSLRMQDRLLSVAINNCRLAISKQESEETKSDQNIPKGLSDNKGKLIELQNEYNLFVQKLERDYPRYKELKYGSEYSNLVNLRKALDEETLLIDYFLSDSSVYILAIGKQNITIEKISTDTLFNKSVDTYLKSIKQFDADKYYTLSSLLYTKLIFPFGAVLGTKPHLIIIPDKILFYLPFETLCPEKPAGENFSKADYLIKNHDIRYHYSAAMFYNSLIKSSEQKQLKNSFIGFAPIFSNDSTQGYVLAYNDADSLTVNETLRMVSADGKKLNELKYTEKEVKDIESLFADKKYPAKAYFSSFANEENFRKMTGNYKYVHIATHGLLNESEPNLSGLVFAQPQDNFRDTLITQGFNTYETNGILYSGEINNLNINADLLVLSACETGTGKLYNGEGVMSLTRGFLATGVPNVVLSLWKVGDYSTMELMVKFYSRFLTGESYSEALQKAKIQLMNNEMYAFPKFWGGFVLIGTNK